MMLLLGKVLLYEILAFVNLFILLAFAWAFVDSVARRVERLYVVCVRSYFLTRNEYLNDLVKGPPGQPKTVDSSTN